MKEGKINLRIDEADEDTLKQAAENLSIMNNEKSSISKTIRAGAKLLAEQDPTKPELFFIHRSALREFQANLEYGQDQIQRIHDEYVAAVKAPVTIEEIQSWFGQYRSDFLVTNKEAIREGIVLKLYRKQKDRYPGLQFTTDNVTMPDLEDLFQVCDRLIFIPFIETRERIFWECYRIVAAKVELIPEVVEGVKNGWRAYAEGPEEKSRLAIIKKVCDIFNSIKLTNPLQLNVPGFIMYDSEAGIYSPMHHYIKGYIK